MSLPDLLFSIFVLTVAVLGVICCSKLNSFLGLADDNPIEEEAEELFEAKTGMKVDFTPDSKEVE